MGHGWEGAVLKLLRGKDFTLTVTGTESVTEHYRRIRVTDGGMLAATGVHPTMWVRLWFEGQGRRHQRAYTLVDPDPARGVFSLEFALHDGRASDWARRAAPGDTIEATVQGSGFTPPKPPPAPLCVIGDTASLPAATSLLAGAPDGVRTTVWFETVHDSDAGLAARLAEAPGRTLHAVRREGGGAALVRRVRETLPGLLGDPAEAYVWIACDTATTRALAACAREHGVPRRRISALGYWRAA
ncbi:siderophore-interacting protein [Streptomyces tremellae]|uniref:Siderophore-interacting protein n=1 Tax=Streptomyces tremellae TaxID=1124239 RepID=A0ABP7G6V3_9ACTN